MSPCEGGEAEPRLVCNRVFTWNVNNEDDFFRWPVWGCQGLQQAKQKEVLIPTRTRQQLLANAVGSIAIDSLGWPT